MKKSAHKSAFFIVYR